MNETTTPTTPTDSKRIIIESVADLDLIEAEVGSNPIKAADVYLDLDPERRRARLITWSDLYGTPIDCYHGIRRRISVTSADGAIDGPSVVQWLRDDEGQALLQAICNGYHIIWDGRNYIGRLDDDAEAAEEQICVLLEDAPGLGGFSGLWAAGDWLQSAEDDIIEEHAISGETSEDRLSEIAEEIDEIAASDNVILHGTFEVLREWRDRIKED